MKTQLTLLIYCVLGLSACSSSKQVNMKSAPPTTQPSSGIVGVWSFVRNVGEPASTDKKTKIILDKHWMFSQADPSTNLTLFHHGGTYLLDGDSYAETIEYANASTGGYLGSTFKYKINVKGDTMVLTGPYSEVWARVK
ncbi:hypothetical protein ACAW74_18360 [Fibrella sp. WM1]|uniref:hypothetical protein n=1 Tax=Fibrella musci TaxID=3242485 RepID=UPI0035208F2C